MLIASILVLDLPLDFLLLPQGIVLLLDLRVNPLVQRPEVKFLELRIELRLPRLLGVLNLVLLLPSRLAFRRRPLELQRELSHNLDGREGGAAADSVSIRWLRKSNRSLHLHVRFRRRGVESGRSLRRACTRAHSDALGRRNLQR